MADEAASAVSGGMLVILGIVVAAGLGFFFLHGNAKAPSAPSISITVPNQ